MHLVNKILIGLIVIATGACFYFSAITLKTHSFWRSEENKLTKERERLNHEILVYEFGEGQPETEGYKRSIHENDKYLRALQDLRGPVFRNCEVRSTFNSNGRFNVYMPGITEDLLPANTPLYAFRPTKNDPSKFEYLGRFLVMEFGVDGDTAQSYVSLEPTRVAYEKNERMTQMLSQSFPGEWTLFLNMPIDKAEHGAKNEDYLPFDVSIQYYVAQEYILQDLIAKQKKQLDYTVSLVGKDAPVDEAALVPIAKTMNGYNINGLNKTYATYEQQSDVMKQSNQALADRVAELERKKAGYQDSINMKIRPISPGPAK